MTKAADGHEMLKINKDEIELVQELSSLDQNLFTVAVLLLK